MAQTPDANGAVIDTNRRRLLKAAGAGAVGLAVIPGGASAHAVFYGCSQVCTHSPGTNRKAIVVKDGNCECRDLTPSDRKDDKSEELPGDDIECYEFQEGEKVVGLKFCSDNDGDDVAESCEYIENDNNCADNVRDCDCGTIPCSSCP